MSPDALIVVNTTGEIIPGFGLMRRTGVNNDGHILVAKPNADGQLCLVNDAFPILANKTGQSVGYNLRNIIAYDQQDGTPASGETWGATNGSWLARKNKAGFQIDGGALRGVVNAVRDWQTAVVSSGRATLGSNFDITAATLTDQATGLTLSIPSAGTYLLTAHVNGILHVPTSMPSLAPQIYFQLRDNTAGAMIIGSQTRVVACQVVNLDVMGTGTLAMPNVTFAGASTIELYAARGFAFTPTLSRLLATNTNIGYVKTG